MRTLVAAVFFVMLSGAVFGAEIDLSKPLPRLRLADGRVLQDVQFVSFKTLDVFVRHKAGSMSLRYEALPDEVRAAAEQKRPGGPRWYPGETTVETVTLEGQVFVQTRGAGPYKFGNVQVYAFDVVHLKMWDETFQREIKLPKPLAVATTDGDGRFKLNVPKDTPYFIYCSTRRLVGGFEEVNEWRVPGEKFKTPKEVILSNNTAQRPTKVVTIEETP